MTLNSTTTPDTLTWVRLVAAVQRGAVGSSEARRLRRQIEAVMDQSFQCVSNNRELQPRHGVVLIGSRPTHNFAKASLEFYVGLT